MHKISRILFFVERNLHLPFLEPIHDYFQQHIPGFQLAFASPAYMESTKDAPGRGLDERAIHRLSAKADYITNIRAFNPDITVVADIGAAYILRDCGRIVNVGHGMISKGCFYTHRPIVRRENMADLICVPGSWHKEILAKNVFCPIEVTGFIKSDGLFGPTASTREQFYRDMTIPNDARILLFAPTYNEELSAIPHVQEQIAELARAEADGETHVVVKLHGMTDRKWIELYENLAAHHSQVHFLPVDYDLARAMTAADLMISDVSSAFVEFMLLDRPIVLFDNPRKAEFMHYDPQDLEYQVRDACIVVSSWEEMREAVLAELRTPDRLSTLRQEYARRMCHGRDGRSVERAALGIARLSQGRYPVRFSIVILWGRGGQGDVADFAVDVRRKNPGVDLELIFVGLRPENAVLEASDRWIACEHVTGHVLDRAVGAARHEHVAFLDSRLVTPLGWLRQLANYFQWEPTTGVVQAIAPGLEQRALLEHLLPDSGRKSDSDVAFIFHRFLQGGGMAVGELDTPCFLLRKQVYNQSKGFPADLGWQKSIRILGLDLRRNGMLLRRAVETFVYPADGSASVGKEIRNTPGTQPAGSVESASCKIPKVSIIIPVFNNKELTKECIKSIQENISNIPFEIIAVNNGSTDGAAGMLKRMQQGKTLRLIANQENLGFAKACNQGAAEACGDFLVFLNNDTRVTPGWLNALVACASSGSDIGAVGAQLLFEDGLVQHAGVVFDHKLKPVHIYKFFHPRHPAVQKQREFQAVSAACMLVKRAVFAQAGGFDEQYVNGYEDVDFCLRLRRDGYKAIYCPKSVVIHLESKTPGRFDAMNANRTLLMQRWGEVLRHDELEYYREDGIRYNLMQEHEHGHVCVMHDSNENPYWKRARTLAERGDNRQAVNTLHQAFRFYAFDPRKVVVLKEMATLYERLGMQSDAEHCLRGVIELEPHPDHYLLLGRAIKRQGRVGEAAAIMKQLGKMS
ncbi:MAG TPA: glycosyltransferase [Desulfonatronum sp.]|nr:glycosyltransferase [Desulfonatronum sp.]